jgi:tripartite-type tricarboxylate transporter receptor subunit TctC
MASAGIGTPPHVAGELFKMITGINMQHIPYRGGAPAVADLVGGQVQIYFGPMNDVTEYIKSGKLRALVEYRRGLRLRQRLTSASTPVCTRAGDLHGHASPPKTLRQGVMVL